MHAVSPSRAVCWRCALTLLVVPGAAATESDPALVARSAIATLEHGPGYAWELRDLDGEETTKTVWVERSPNALLNDVGKLAPLRKKIKVSTLSPTVHGELRQDGWGVTQAGFAQGPAVMAVIHPSGARVVRSDQDGWLTVEKFRRAYGPLIADPTLVTERKAQMKFSASWALFTSPLPHVLLPELLRTAGPIRSERDEIVMDVDAASARLLLGRDGGSRKLAPDRFKGTVRLRVRAGLLQECRIQFEYEVDLAQAEDPCAEGIDILILFLPPSSEPPAVPEAARAALSDR